MEDENEEIIDVEKAIEVWEKAFNKKMTEEEKKQTSTKTY